MSRFRILALLPLLAMLGACNPVVLDPSGYIALQQRDLLLISTGLMLLIIIPVMGFTVLFAWRYRQSNTDAAYDPDWDHSTQLELVIWAVPLLIVICIGAVTWAGTHLLDPYRPLTKISDDNIIPENVQPLRVDVVALDWKWLFIYPEQGIATVNELAAPIDRAIEFHITSSSVMNSFYIPALAGQIYAMPAMETRLHAVMNKPGVYDGFSANYSGAGFSGMTFKFHGLAVADFDKWVSDAKAGGGNLDRAAYLQLEQPTENEPVRRYAGVDPELFQRILNLCVEEGKMCMHEMAAIDAKGGLGLAGVRNTLPLTYDKYARRGSPGPVLAQQRSYVVGICEVGELVDANLQSEPKAPASVAPLLGRSLPRPPLSGAGLPRPSLLPSGFPSTSWFAAPRRATNS